MFQLLMGTEALNPVFEEILDRVCERMKGDFLPIELKKHILGIFLSAFGYNASATLKFLEQRGLTGQLITEILTLSDKQMKHEYEKKLFILGLSSMLRSDALPPCIQPHFLDLIKGLISQTSKLIKQVENRKRKEEKEA